MRKNEYRELPYQFTDPELLIVSKQLSEKIRELAQVEENKKSAVSQYDGRLKALKSVVAVLSENVGRGHEYRSIECAVYLDNPRKGFKLIVRTDTHEVVAEEHMTYDDRQTVIEWERKASSGGNEPVQATLMEQPEETEQPAEEPEPVEHDTAGRENEGSDEEPAQQDPAAETIDFEGELTKAVD